MVASPLGVGVGKTSSHTGNDVAIEHDTNDHTEQRIRHLQINKRKKASAALPFHVDYVTEKRKGNF